jgi:hypothetical protein
VVFFSFENYAVFSTLFLRSAADCVPARKMASEASKSPAISGAFA